MQTDEVPGQNRKTPVHALGPLIDRCAHRSQQPIKWIILSGYVANTGDFDVSTPVTVVNDQQNYIQAQ
jgi:hypothetical protein